MTSFRVLLVDDSDEARMIARMCLHGSPYAVEEAESAEAALELLTRSEYDAILLDVELPGMSGPECAARIRRLGGRFSSVPIIALTGHTAAEELKRIADAGCSSYLSKPVDKNQLLDGLGQALAGAERPCASPPVDPDVAELIPGYLRNRRKDVLHAREALARSDFGVLKRIGHNIRGTGPSYGFPELGSLGSRIEEEALARDLRRLEASIAELEALIGEYLSQTET